MNSHMQDINIQKQLSTVFGAPKGEREPIETTTAEGRKRLRILIIAHAFPPMNSTASHRPYSWAKTWSQMGHEVHVLTPKKHAFDGAMNLTFDISGFTVHTVPYLTGDKGGGSVDAFEGRRVARWEQLKTYTRRIRFGFGMFADLRMLAYRPLVRKGSELLGEAKYNFIISTCPPQIVHLAAFSLAKKSGVPWIADYRDLWHREMLIHQFRLTSFLTGLVNGYVLRNAKAVSTVSEGLAQRLRDWLPGKEITVAYNGFFDKQYAGSPKRRAWNDSKIHIVYTGRVYPRKRDPEMLLKALHELKKSGLDLASRMQIDFYGHYDPWLVELIKRYGVSDVVERHGFVSYEESVATQKAADLLLFLDWTDNRAEGVLTGKLFEYLASRRPVLSVATNRASEAGRIMRSCKVGVVLTSIEEIRKYIVDLLVRSPLVEPDEAAINVYSREAQAKRLLERVTTVLNET